VAVIGFSMAACGGDDDGGGGGGDPDLSGTITISPSTATINTELTATYTGSETVSYQWKNNSTNVGTDSDTFTPTAAGSYTVTVSATGFKSKTSAAVNVTDPNLPTVEMPVATPPAGTYTTAQNVTLTTTTSGAKIYYSINGTDPTTASTLYSSAISINATTTVKAIAVKDGMNNSNILTAVYTIGSGGGGNATTITISGLENYAGQYAAAITDWIDHSRLIGSANDTVSEARNVTGVLIPDNGTVTLKIYDVGEKTKYTGSDSDVTFYISIGTTAQFNLNTSGSHKETATVSFANGAGIGTSPVDKVYITINGLTPNTPYYCWVEGSAHAYASNSNPATTDNNGSVTFYFTPTNLDVGYQSTSWGKECYIYYNTIDNSIGSTVYRSTNKYMMKTTTHTLAATDFVLW